MTTSAFSSGCFSPQSSRFDLPDVEMSPNLKKETKRFVCDLKSGGTRLSEGQGEARFLSI